MERVRTPASATDTATAVWPESLDSHRARQSQNIAHAALGIIEAEGISGLSMSAIADAAGVSRQTLYKYYRDVDAVLVALASAIAGTDAQLAELVEAEEDVRDALRVIVSAVVRAASTGHPSAATMTAALPPDARASLEAHAHRAEALVIDLVHRGRTDGTFRTDLDPELDGRIAYRAIVGAHDLAAERGADVEILTDHLTGAVLRMLEGTTTARRRARGR